VKKKSTTPLRAIREYCVDSCSCGSAEERKLCPVITCPLWPFRFGRNPYRTPRKMTEEQRKRAIERLAKAREAKNESSV